MFSRVVASRFHRSKFKRGRKTANNSAARRGMLRLAGCEQLEHRVLLTAAAITWTGASATSANWSDPANWDLGRAPMDGDSLVFPASAKQLANNDDIAGLSVNSLTFQGMFTASGGYTLSGDDLTVGTGGVVDISSINAANARITNQIDLNTTLATAETWSIDDDYSYGEHQLTVNGNVNNNGFALTAHGTGTVDVTGQISGSGSLIAVGVPAGFTDAIPSGTSFGGLTLDLDHANTYTGGTYIGNSAAVVVSVDGALGPGGTNDGGTTVDQDGEILLNAIAYTTPEAITVNAGTLTGSGSASFYGPITVTGSLTLFNNDASTTLAGDVHGSGTLTKLGRGTFDLTAANGFTGTTNVNTGALLVDGSTAAGNAINVAAGATLGGEGTVGGAIAVTAAAGQLGVPPASGGRLDPGAGPDPSKVTGTLSNAGGVILGSNQGYSTGPGGPAVFAVQLGSTAANPANDQLDSTGSVFLQFTSLDVTALPGAGPFNAGQQFVIIQAGEPISGMFDGLPMGSAVSDGVQSFTISYANNRVTLTALPLGAGAITWTGKSTTSNNWSDPANWDLGRAPIDGDLLVFPASAQQLANNDDIPGLSVTSVAFQGTFSSDGYTLSGDDLTVGAGGIVGSSSVSGDNTAFANQIDLNLSLAAAQKWSISEMSSASRLTVNGTVATNGFGLTATGVGTVDIEGQISGSGSLHVEGELIAVALTAQIIGGGGGGLTLDLNHANSYTGGTYVDYGTLAVSADGALGPGGTNDAGTTIGPDGQLQFNAITYTTPEAITLNGGTLMGAGDSSFSGPITISGRFSLVFGAIASQDAEIVETQPSKTFTLNGPTLTNNGTGNLLVHGDELLPLAGGSQQFASPDVVINNLISGAGGLTITTGALALGAANTYQGSTYLQGPATLIINTDNAIPSTSAVVMQSYGAPGFSAIELNGHADTIGSLAGTRANGAGNTVDLGTGGSLTTGGDNSSTTFDGDITGSGTLTKLGRGTFDLTGSNDFMGSTNVNAGTLLVDGSTAAGNILTVNGAILGGDGTVSGTITLNGGTMDPGAGTNPFADAGTLFNTGGVTLNPLNLANPPLATLATFSLELGGSSASPASDQLQSAAEVSLSGVTLTLSTLAGAGLFNPGQQFVIIQAGAPIAGTFADLPEGSTISDGTQQFTISYANNRVTLTAQPLPLSAIYVNGQPGDGTAATFAHNLYREVLGREPEAGGQAFWVNLFDQDSSQGGAAVAQRTIAADFLNSSEYRGHLVAGMYENFLHRQANTNDLAFWTSKLAAGMDERSVLADILGSDEYAFDALGPGIHPANTYSDAAAWASALYRDLLGRTADAGGLAYWASQGSAHDTPSGRAALAFEFLGAAEVDHKLLNGNYPGPTGTVGAPGSPASGDYALAEITGNGWDNLYFQGKLSSDAVDTLFNQLQAGEDYGGAIAGMLDMQQYFGG